MSNPLLEQHVLPPFDRIEVAHIEPAITQLLDESRARINAMLDSVDGKPTWDNLMAQVEAVGDRIEQAWAPVSHLNGVLNSDPLREAYNSCLPKLTEYSTEMGQNRRLFEACQRLKESEEYTRLSVAQRKVIDNALRDFHLAGVDLPPEQQQQYGALQKRLAELTTTFANNVLDATHGWFKHITDEAALAGLPESALEGARQAAAARELDGFVITLDVPSYLPVMQYADNRALREELYTAYVTRASDQGPTAGQWDNNELMKEILALRHQLARLLGYDNYAGLSLATKMAKEPDQVVAFLEELAQKSLPVARADYAELRQFAADKLGLADLQAWDVSYASEKLREAKYAVSQEALRPYFPVETVINGMFAVVNKLYGIEVVVAPNNALWHPDARFYHIKRNGEVIAQFYLDLFARAHKRGGAWMADCRVRRRRGDGSLQLPAAFLTCNFTPPTATRPSLLTHDEVTTLFHEFGHGLHHMLTQIDCAGVSGINGVAWDAVELPSQFMENWCWEEEALALFSGHYQTGEPLPKALLDKMLAAKNFQTGMQMMRQLEFALFDFLLHKNYDPQQPRDIQSVLDEVRQKVAVYPVPAFNRFQCSFTHIFAGGYAAGYYSYKWAEVLSADAFSLFEENGVFDRATGEKFLHDILEQGGSREPLELFVHFRGREPSPDALLRHNGIVMGATP